MSEAACSYEYHRDNRSALYDGHGIFLTYVCPKCRAAKLRGFRADIFDLYDTDEQIEEID